MRESKLIPILAIVFAASAAMLSFRLLAVHFNAASSPAWFAAGCSEDSASGSDCAAVLASPYSYWPPKTANEPQGTRHIPVALVGLLYYSVLTIWLLGVGRVSFDRRFWHLIPMALTAFGLFASVDFVFIMITKIDEWCLWCLVTHALNLLIATCLLLMWPRRVAAEPGVAEGQKEASQPRVPPHPSSRLIVTTLLAVWLALFGLMQYYGLATRTKEGLALKFAYRQCFDTIKNLTADAGVLLAMWHRAEEREIAVRSDDPVRLPNPSGSPPLEAVVFSDLECPSCKRLARFLDEKVQPLFDGRLRLVFKHYPLNRACNPVSSTQIHRYACDGAAMVEAARTLGGSEAFWQAHDFVFAQQDRLKLGQLRPSDVAAALGLDLQPFTVAMNSSAVRKRIGEDAKTARTCGVRATPALFVSGKEVRAPARDDIRFWDRLADQYWLGLNEPRPPSTMLKEKPEQAP